VTRAAVALAAVVALSVAASCSEEDRRAWVSVLPLSDSEEERPAVSGGPFAVSSDSTAVLLGVDTLFTLADLPARSPDGSAITTARIARAEFAPDSASVVIELTGPTIAIVVWSRPKQVGIVAAEFPDGAVTALEWSPDGRLLAFEGRDAEGVTRSGVFDLEAGSSGRHPVLQWLARRGQSVRLQDWLDSRRLRLLVSPGAEPEGGLAYVWDIERGALVLEAHLESLAAQAPSGAPQPGGVFSLDLAGDPAPETVALYQALGGAPGAMVLTDVGPAGVRGAASEPLVGIEVLGFETWEDAPRGPALYQIAEIGGRTTLLLALPSPGPVALIGLFQAEPQGGLTAIPVATTAGAAPAVFPDGAVGGEMRELGIADLDGDGAPEVVSARGVADPIFREIQWSAEVYRWDDGRLVPSPGLEPAAIERLGRMTGG
jgi:hypothetical protein